MRPIRDRRLPAPMHAWIDSARPIPPHVRLLPRTVKVFDDLVGFLMLGGLFGAVGAVYVYLLLGRVDLQKDGLGVALLLTSAAAGMFSVPTLLALNLWRTLSAARAVRRGKLRLGIFLGPEGLLARPAADRCVVVPWDRFVVARRFPPVGSRDFTRPKLIVESQDGVFECLSDSLDGGVAEIHRAAAAFAGPPQWAPPPGPRADRAQRLDVQARSARTWAAAAFVATLSATLAAAGGAAAAGPAGEAWLAPILWLGAAATAAGGMLVYRMRRLGALHRCPDCGRRRLPRVEPALPAIHFYCPDCNVEWDVGRVLSLGEDDDGPAAAVVPGAAEEPVRPAARRKRDRGSRGPGPS